MNENSKGGWATRLLVFVCAVLSAAAVWADGVNEPIPSFYQEPGLSPNRMPMGSRTSPGPS